MTKTLPKKKYLELKKKLHEHRKRARIGFVASHKKAAQWLVEKQLHLPDVKSSTKLLTSASLFGTLLISSGNYQAKLLPSVSLEEKLETGLTSGKEINNILQEDLDKLLVSESIGRLNPKLQEEICRIIEKVLGIDACFDLEGIKLNHAYGWMGYEQHLKRFPGDTLTGHNEEQLAGIAPGLGGWGHFAKSRVKMTDEIIQREKYYVAVQTLYMPEWNTKTKELYQWFKFRKVLAINPENGQAVVGVVGDAGPAQWTGKQFGGSPELMKELDLHLGPRKGKVLLLFLNDPDNQIPLGPIDYNFRKGPLKEA